jgi:hypothetical protein
VSARVLVTESAESQIREALGSQEHASAELLLDEIEKGMRLLGEAPGAGAPFARARQPGTRRLLLGRTWHWLYYTVDPKHDLVYLLALWSNRQGSDPPGL